MSSPDKISVSHFQKLLDMYASYEARIQEHASEKNFGLNQAELANIAQLHEILSQLREVAMAEAIRDAASKGFGNIENSPVAKEYIFERSQLLADEIDKLSKEIAKKYYDNGNSITPEIQELQQNLKRKENELASLSQIKNDVNAFITFMLTKSGRHKTTSKIVYNIVQGNSQILTADPSSQFVSFHDNEHLTIRIPEIELALEVLSGNTTNYDLLQKLHHYRENLKHITSTRYPDMKVRSDLYDLGIDLQGLSGFILFKCNQLRELSDVLVKKTHIRAAIIEGYQKKGLLKFFNSQDLIDASVILEEIHSIYNTMLNNVTALTTATRVARTLGLEELCPKVNTEQSMGELAKELVSKDSLQFDYTRLEQEIKNIVEKHRAELEQQIAETTEQISPNFLEANPSVLSRIGSHSYDDLKTEADLRALLAISDILQKRLEFTEINPDIPDQEHFIADGMAEYLRQSTRKL